MVGNVWEWVEDTYQDSYARAPMDGSAVETAGSRRVLRGGSFFSRDAESLRADFRVGGFPGLRNDLIGLRLARSSR
jgi:formylglycine-generating enzyme required for sulfatase activity